MKNKIILAVVVCLSILYSVFAAASSSLKVINYAGAPINIYWVNTFQKDIDYVPQTKKPVRNNTEAAINSYDTHQFQVRFLDDSDAEVVFTKGPEDETIYVKYDEEKNELYIQQISDVDKLMEFFNEELDKCFYNHNAEESLADCIADSVVEEMSRIEKTKSVMKYYQDIMSDKLMHYACNDKNKELTKSSKEFRFRFLGDLYHGQEYADTDQMKIFTINNFLTAEDCAVVKQRHEGYFTEKRIKRNLKNPSTSEYTLEMKEDPLWTLYSKSLYFLNYKGKMPLVADGKPKIEVSQYPKGSGIKPECDGLCNGEDFVKGEYVATALFECSNPKSGGEMVFPAAGIYFRPARRSATFITYKGSDNKMDEGYGKYGSCPVEDGERFMIKMKFKEGLSTVGEPSVTLTATPTAATTESVQSVPTTAEKQKHSGSEL